MAFGKSTEIKKLPNSSDILSLISEKEIFIHYLGGIPKRPICSPLRNDKIPSFSLFHSHKYNKLFFNDFATKETGDCFVFVMRLFNYSHITDAFVRIASDFNLTQFQTTKAKPILVKKTYVEKNNSGEVRRDKINIKVTTRDWTQKDKDYWHKKYGLTEAQLEYCGIYPISHFFLNSYCKVAEELAYAFVEEKDGLQTFKIYQPLSQHYKWINNNDYSVWELWTQLPAKGNILIITSSRKDAAVIKALFPSCSVSSCALQSEGVNPKDSVMMELKKRFKHIYVLYDNDQGKEKNWGRIAGEKLVNEFDLKQLEIPDSYNINDISDFREIKGKEHTKQLIISLIRDANKKES